MTTLKYLFGTNCVSLNEIFGPYEYLSYNIRYLSYKVVKVTPNKGLRAHCYIKMGNSVVHDSCLYKMNIDTNTYISLSFRGLITHQGHLTNKRKKIMREGSLTFRRIGWFCPKYLPRSVSVFIPTGKLCSFSCVFNVRVIVTHLEYDGIHMINLHCLDTPRVIRQSLPW